MFGSFDRDDRVPLVGIELKDPISSTVEKTPPGFTVGGMRDYTTDTDPGGSSSTPHPWVDRDPLVWMDSFVTHWSVLRG